MRSIAGVAVRGHRVFVARRRPGGMMGGRWEFPGGKREAGEDDSATALREFDEEFGLSVSTGAVLGESSFSNDGKSYELAAMLVSFDGEPRFLLEHIESRWVGADELVALDLADSDRSLLPLVLPLLVVA